MPALSPEREVAPGPDVVPATDLFPDILVESVRWHPQPSRRVARIQLQHAGPLELREGDIVAGALVRRIDPAAIEVQVGETRKRVAILP